MATTHDRIIVATNELFRRRGYNGTTLSEISKASGATIGSIYHFFPGGKEDLAVAVIDVTGRIYRELFESVAAAATDPAAAFEDMFVGAAQVLEETDYIDPCPIGTVAREVANTSEPLRTAAERALRSWIAAARDHLTAAGVSEPVAQELGELFVATIEGSFVLSRAQRDTSAMATSGRFVAQLAERAITQAVGSGRETR